MKTTPLSLVALAVLSSATAFADPFEHGAVAVRHEGRHAWGEFRHTVRTGGPIYRGPVSTGHYEWRGVQRWVDGQYQQQWVAGACFTNRWGHQRCAPGAYQNVWVPGRYVTVQEQVWVSTAYGATLNVSAAPCE